MSNLETQEAEKTGEVSAVEPQVAESEETVDIVAREVEKLEAKEPGKAESENLPEKTVESADVPEKPAPNPFSAWKKEAQEKLSALDEDTKKFIIERESQFHKGIEKYKDEARFAKTIKKAFSPHSEYLQSLNITPDFAISHLINTERQLRMGSAEEKARMFQHLASDYGVDLGTISQLPFNPETNRLQQQIANLERRIAQPHAAQQAQEEELLDAHIEEFAQTHEHFDELRGDMGLLLQEGKAKDLDDAYAKAIRLNDGLFESFQTKQFEDLKRREAVKANEAAKAAKAAAVSVRGAPNGVSYSGTPATTEDAVRMAMRQHGLLN